MNDRQNTTTNPLNEPSSAISLGLSIPEQSPAPADSVLLDPKDTQQWIAALPMANIGETARQVYSTLVKFNRYQINDLIRAKSIEQFRNPIDYICTNLQRHYFDTGFPLSSKGWKTSTLSRELNAELAISYKIIIEHMLAGDSQQFDRKLLVIALHRTLHYLGRVLLQTALAYAPWPKGVWKEINSIYAFASQNHVHKVPVKSTSRKKSDISSIEDNYKALLLFATAVPYRMRQQHINQLFQETRQWSPIALISSVNDEPTASPVGRFNIDLWSDAPPIHNALKLPTENNRSILIDLRSLLKKLREDFEQAPTDKQSNLSNTNASSIMSRPLLRQLILAWSRPPERDFTRTKLNFDLNIVTGIHAIHGNLSGELASQTFQSESNFLDEFTPLSSEPNTSPAPSIAGLGSGLSLSPMNTDFNADSLINDSYLNTPSTDDSLTNDWQDSSKPSPPPSTPTMKVSTKNESAGGYCIQWKTDTSTKVKLGELIGVESSSQKQHYGLGVIRWLRHSSQHDFEVGLQMMSNHIEAGQVYLANTEGSRKKFDTQRINCLLLTAADTDIDNNISSLVVSNLCYPVDSNLWLNTDSQKRLIRLTKLIEFNNSFAQFQFSYINQNEVKLRNSALNDEGNDFDDLWTNL